MGMTQTHTPKFVQSLIVLSNSRKELFAAAMNNARKSLGANTQPFVETVAEHGARVRAERDSFSA